MKTFSDRTSEWEAERAADLCAFCGQEIGWDAPVELDLNLPDDVNCWVHRICQAKKVETTNFTLLRGVPSVNNPEYKRFTIKNGDDTMYLGEGEPLELAIALMKMSDMDWMSTNEETRNRIILKLESLKKEKDRIYDSHQRYLLGEHGKVSNSLDLVRSMDSEGKVARALDTLVFFLKKLVS